MPHPDSASDTPIDQTLPQNAAGSSTIKVPLSPTDVTLKQEHVEPALPKLPDRFEIVGALGQGAYGLVLHAIDRQRHMPVALKLLRQAEVAGLATFKQEFYTLADLHHPNIIILYELFAADPPWFFTMELLEGATHFQSYIQAHPEKLREALGQLALGVAALHAAGKLHRDLKSSNVLVTPAGRVVVTDFGLAAPVRAVDGRGPSGLVGTVPYMAPEQGADRPVTPASDWYSVGVMLYEALTGRLPFERSPGSMWDYLRLKLETDPPPPSEVVHGLPGDLNDLCVALLRREPTARPTGGEACRRLGVPPRDRGGPSSPACTAGPAREKALFWTAS
jgi:serine/threonine protein kinase